MMKAQLWPATRNPFFGYGSGDPVHINGLIAERNAGCAGFSGETSGHIQPDACPCVARAGTEQDAGVCISADVF
jgi:hypothetical protein